MLRPRLVCLRVYDSTCTRRGRDSVAGTKVSAWRGVTGGWHARGARRLAQNRGNDRWDRLRLVSAEVAARALVAAAALVQIGVATPASCTVPVLHPFFANSGKRGQRSRPRAAQPGARLSLAAAQTSRGVEAATVARSDAISSYTPIIVLVRFASNKQALAPRPAA